MFEMCAAAAAAQERERERTLRELGSEDPGARASISTARVYDTHTRETSLTDAAAARVYPGCLLFPHRPRSLPERVRERAPLICPCRFSSSCSLSYTDLFSFSRGVERRVVGSGRFGFSPSSFFSVVASARAPLISRVTCGRSVRAQ